MSYCAMNAVGISRAQVECTHLAKNEIPNGSSSDFELKGSPESFILEWCWTENLHRGAAENAD